MQTFAPDIQPYADSADLASAFILWQITVGRQWPVDFLRFRQILAGPEPLHLVAKVRGQLVGLAACTLSQESRTGYLQALLVAPAWQRQGLGSALHDSALQQLRARGAHYAQAGGLVPRFWCGLPANLPAARTFFSTHGWECAQPVYDLIQDLRQYSAAPALFERIAREGITLAQGRAEHVSQILEFEERTFPSWLHHYADCARLGDFQDMLLARQRDGRIVGTLLMSTPHSQKTRTDIVWRVLLGYDAGALGAVGVAPDAQGRGIGLALVAQASDLLQRQGVRNGYIDWVQRPDFYARLGYTRWRAFFTCRRELV